MINIHVGDAAAASSMCRWDGPAIVSARAHAHTRIHIMRAMKSAVWPVVTAVSWEVQINRLI